MGVKEAVGTAASEPEKKDVMKHMAELWLREEVYQREAESRVKATPYLVVDGSALITNLKGFMGGMWGREFRIT